MAQGAAGRAGKSGQKKMRGDSDSLLTRMLGVRRLLAIGLLGFGAAPVALAMQASQTISTAAGGSPHVPAVGTLHQPSWASAGFIAYKCGDSLCLIRPDGIGNRRLLGAAHPWPQWDPAFSPDGRTIAFRGYYGLGDGEYALYAVGTNGCEVRKLSRSIAGDPTWSSDGKWIAFDTSGEGKILKVHSNGTGLTRIVGATGADYDSSPAWSPDGTRIAFVHYHAGHGQIWVMTADGSRAKPLHEDAQASDAMPVWSHDGTRIAFVAQAWPRSWIQAMHADGTTLRVLTRKQGEAWNRVVAE